MKQSRKDAARIRGEVIGILNRMRKNLVLEVKDDASLPKDLDAQVFGYLDLLEKTSADTQAKGKPAEEAPPPEAEATEEGDGSSEQAEEAPPAAEPG